MTWADAWEALRWVALVWTALSVAALVAAGGGHAQAATELASAEPIPAPEPVATAAQLAALHRELAAMRKALEERPVQLPPAPLAGQVHRPGVRRCESCGAELAGQRPDARFCDSTCRSRAWRGTSRPGETSSGGLVS